MRRRDSYLDSKTCGKWKRNWWDVAAGGRDVVVESKVRVIIIVILTYNGTAVAGDSASSHDLGKFPCLRFVPTLEVVA